MDRRVDNIHEDWSQQDVAWDGLLLTSNSSNGNDASVPIIDKYYIKGRGQASGGAGTSAPSPSKCRVPGCTSDLNRDLAYFRKYRICREHLKSPVLIVEGVPSRFCQQCSRFHHVREFDGPQRTCRTMLERLRIRRNQGKSQPESGPTTTGVGGGGGSGSRSRGHDTHGQGDSTPGGSSSQSTSSGKKVMDQAQRATTSGSNGADNSAAVATAAVIQTGDSGSPGTSDPSCHVPQAFMLQPSYNDMSMAAAGSGDHARDLPSSNLSVYLNNNVSLLPLPRTTPRGMDAGREQSASQSFFCNAPYGLGAAVPPPGASSLMSPTASVPSAGAMLLRPPSGTRSPLDLTSRVAGDETLELQLQDIYREMAIAESSHAPAARPSLYDKLTSLSNGPLLPLRSSSLHAPPLPLLAGSPYNHPGAPTSTPNGTCHPTAAHMLGQTLSGGRVLATATAAGAIANPAPGLTNLHTPVRGAPAWQSYGMMAWGRPPGVTLADAMEFDNKQMGVPNGGPAAGSSPAWQLQMRTQPLPPQQQQQHTHPHPSVQRTLLSVADALPRHTADSGPQSHHHHNPHHQQHQHHHQQHPQPHHQPHDHHHAHQQPSAVSTENGFPRVQQPLPQHVFPPQPQDPSAMHPSGRMGATGPVGSDADRLDAVFLRSGSGVISLGSGLSSLTLNLGSNLGLGGGSLHGLLPGSGSGAGGGGTPAGAAGAVSGGSSLLQTEAWRSLDNIDAALDVLMTEAGSGVVYHMPEEPPSLERLCLKLHHMHPRDLPPDLLAGMTSWLAGAPAELVQGAIRPGCTQLILDVYVRRIGGGGTGSVLQAGGEDGGEQGSESLRARADGSGGNGGEARARQRVLGLVPEAVAAAAAKGSAGAAGASSGSPTPDTIRVLGGALEACSNQEVEEVTRSDAKWAEPIARGGKGADGSSGGASSSPDTEVTTAEQDPVESLSAYVMHGGNVRAAAASFRQLLGQRAVQSMAVSVRHQVLILSGPNDGTYITDSRGTLAGLNTPLLLDVSPRAVVAGGSCVLNATGAHLTGPGSRPHIRCQGTHVACSIMAVNGDGEGGEGGNDARSVGADELGPQLVAATLEGSHRAAATANYAVVQVGLPAAPDAGLMALEWEVARGTAGMAVSEWLPLLAVPDHGMAAEINQMAVLRGPGDDRLRRFLVDLGLLLDYTSRLAQRVLVPALSVRGPVGEEGEGAEAEEEGRTLARRQEVEEKDVHDVTESSFSGDSCGTDQSPSPSSEGTPPANIHDSRLELSSRPRISIKHHARVAELAPQLLAFAADSGMSCCFSWLLDFNLEHVHYGDLAAVFDAAAAVGGPTSLPLLHRVVRGGNARLLRMLLARTTSRGFACNMAQPWGPFLITPLHLAALQPLNTSLLHACHSAGPHVAQLWDVLPDAAGRTPAVYMKERRKKVLLSGALSGSSSAVDGAAIGDIGCGPSGFMYDCPITYRSWGSEDNIGEAAGGAAAAGPLSSGASRTMAADFTETARRAYESLPNWVPRGDGAAGERGLSSSVATGGGGLGGGGATNGESQIHGGKGRAGREAHVPDSVEDFRERPEVWGDVGTPTAERGVPARTSGLQNAEESGGRPRSTREMLGRGVIAAAAAGEGGVAVSEGATAAPGTFWNDSAEDWLGVQKRLQSLQQEDEDNSLGACGSGQKGPKWVQGMEASAGDAKQKPLSVSAAAGGLDASTVGLVAHVTGRRVVGLASVLLLVAMAVWMSWVTRDRAGVWVR